MIYKILLEFVYIGCRVKGFELLIIDFWCSVLLFVEFCMVFLMVFVVVLVSVIRCWFFVWVLLCMFVLLVCEGVGFFILWFWMVFILFFWCLCVLIKVCGVVILWCVFCFVIELSELYELCLWEMIWMNVWLLWCFIE